MTPLLTSLSALRLPLLGAAFALVLGTGAATPTAPDLAAAHKQVLAGYDCLYGQYNPVTIASDTNMFFTPENVEAYRGCPAYPALQACFGQGAVELTTVNRDALYLVEEETDYGVARRQRVLLYVRSGRPSKLAVDLGVKDLAFVAPGVYRGTRTIW